MIKSIRLLAALCVITLLTMALQWWSGRSSVESTSASIDALQLAFDPLPSGLMGTTASLGLLLLGAWLLGRLFDTIRLPKISGYLIFGLILGPELVGVISAEQLPRLKLVENLAIALIALTAGGEIELAFLKRAGRLIASVAILQVVITLLAVLAGVYAIGPMIGLTGSARTITAFIIGAVATASSPAVFIALMNELHATGEKVAAALSIMVVKDLFLVVLFSIVLAFSTASLRNSSIAPVDDPAGAQSLVETAPTAPADTADAVLTDTQMPKESLAKGLSEHLLGSLLAGILFGVFFAWYMHAVKEHLAIFIVCGCLSIALVSDLLQLEALIVALVAGLLMRNVWKERVGMFFHTLEDLSLPVYCVFFAVAGAKLDLGAITTLWPAALAIVFLRAGALWTSTKLGCWIAGEGAPAKQWMWVSFLPQAGVAIALISIAADAFAEYEFAAVLYSLALASVAIHEIVGPIILKIGLKKLAEPAS